MKKIFGTVLCLLLLILCSGAMASEAKMPVDLKTIADEAFMGDESLTAVIFPDGLETIGKNAFAHTGLTAVTIPGSVSSIGEGAFAGCDGLTILCEAGSAAETYAINTGTPYILI